MFARSEIAFMHMSVFVCQAQVSQSWLWDWETQAWQTSISICMKIISDLANIFDFKKKNQYVNNQINEQEIADIIIL